MPKPPILSNKHYTEPSVFTAENLLREARRQKSLARAYVPRICVLDPDGDILRWLVATHRAERDPHWACYHTDLFTIVQDHTRFGIIGCAVGASFAVLVAEELFASGCELLVSVTSAGQVVGINDPPYFVLIEKALRDDGRRDPRGIRARLRRGAWLQPGAAGAAASQLKLSVGRSRRRVGVLPEVTVGGNERGRR